MSKQTNHLDALLSDLRREREALLRRIAESDKRGRTGTAVDLTRAYAEDLALEGTERRIADAEQQKAEQRKGTDARDAFGTFLDNLDNEADNTTTEQEQ